MGNEDKEDEEDEEDETNAETCIEVQMRESRPARWCNAGVVRAPKAPLPYLRCQY